MIGTIKIIGANNATHLEWMEKDFSGCNIKHDQMNPSVHHVEVPERGTFPLEITKCWLLDDYFIFEGFAHIEDSLGKLAFEFRPE